MNRLSILTLFLFLFLPVKAQDGSISVTDASVAKGTYFSLPVYISMDSEVTAFQYDIYLPEGVEISKDGSTYAVSSGALLKDGKHQIFCAKRANGSYRVVCYSTTNSPLSMRNGELMKIKLLADSNMDAGTYPIHVKKAEIVLAKSLDTTLPGQTDAKLYVGEADEEDGIGEIVVDQEPSNGETYDLLGRKVSRIRSGQINIINSRKVLNTRQGK